MFTAGLCIDFFADSMQQIHYLKRKLLPKEVQKFTSTITIKDQIV